MEDEYVNVPLDDDDKQQKDDDARSDTTTVKLGDQPWKVAFSSCRGPSRRPRPGKCRQRQHREDGGRSGATVETAVFGASKTGHGGRIFGNEARGRCG